MKKNFTKDLNLNIKYSPFFIKTFSLAMKEVNIIKIIVSNNK